MMQSIRYLKTRDGVRLAWASLGQGPTRGDESDSPSGHRR